MKISQKEIGIVKYLRRKYNVACRKIVILCLQMYQCVHVDFICNIIRFKKVKLFSAKQLLYSAVFI